MEVLSSRNTLSLHDLFFFFTVSDCLKLNYCRFNFFKQSDFLKKNKKGLYYKNEF